MPTIRIKSKGLPKAQYQNSQVDGQLLPGFKPITDGTDIFPPDYEKDKENERRAVEEFNKAQDRQQDLSLFGPLNKQDDVDIKYQSDPTFQTNYDFSLIGAQDNKKEQRKYNKFIQKKYDPFYNVNKLSNIGAWSGVGLGLLSAGVNYADNRKKQKDWDSWFRKQNLPENMYAVSPGGDRGDFTQDGIFRPNQLTPPNIGSASVAEYGGTQSLEDMNLIKIRLRPTGQEMMKYGGQSGLGMGLDIGQRRVYTHMPKGKVDGVSNTLNPIPRDQANIEAEKGETAYGDMDGDGALEHFNIGGKRHVNGGTPLNVPEGSFIFSDTKKMIIKDPIILEKFGLSPRKEGYTPAEIAKKYDVNKYKAIMEDPNTDYVRKNTAQIMIKSFQKKLAELAIIQESMKGFPQGIPEIAKQTNPELAEKYAQEFGLVEEGLEDEANEQEQVMERGMTEPEQEMMGEEESIPEEEMMEEEIPQARHGGSRLPRYQGTTGSSTVYNDASLAAVNPFFDPAASTTPTEPNYSQDELEKMYSWYKPYTESKTEKGRISRTTGKSTLFDPNVPNQYKNVDYWVKDAKSKGTDINNIGQLQRYIYGELEKDDPDAIQGMWETWGPTLKSNEKNIENFADTLAGARTADALTRRRQTSVVGYVCTGRDANGTPQIQSSSYKDANAMRAAGAVSSSTEAEKQCPEKPEELTPPGTMPPGRKPIPDRYGWSSPDIVNLAAAAAIPPRKFLPYIAPTQYEQGRLSLEDWRAQAAQRQAMYNKQAEMMGVYGPTTGQGAAQSAAAGQMAEGLAGDIAGVTSRNVDRVNQFLQQERQRKDQFNLLGSNRATELYKGNVIANQADDNANRQYINNLAKAYGQGTKNASMLGMLNAVNPMFKVNPYSLRSYFTGKGKGFDRFSKSTGQSMAASFPALKNQYMAMGMKEDNAEKMAIKALTGSKGTASNSPSDYLSGYNSLFNQS
jgi:hypothetical protein